MGSLTDEQKKLGLFTAVMLLFFVAVALVLNQVAFIRLKSDIYLRWYATVQLFTEERDVYDVRNSQEVDEIVYGRDSGLASGFYYPAHLLLFTGPLALLSYRTAHLIWTVAVQVFYLTALLALVLWCGWPASANQKTVFMTAVIISIPSMQHAIWGQFNTLGILSLSLAYIALCKNRFGRAGVLAAGMTFKPHTSVLTLVFLAVWAVFRRRRWPFLGGTAVAGLALWLVAEWMQPGWVFSFLGALGRYLPATSVVDAYWNPYQLVSGLLVLATMALFIWNRGAAADSPEFRGGLVLSLSVWSLVVPAVGMFHILALPLGIILMLAYYQQEAPRLYRLGVWVLALVYLLGWLGFVVGTAVPDLFGDHIYLTEFVYKALLPLAVTLLSLPMCVPAARIRRFLAAQNPS